MDVEAIKQLKARYFRTMDTKDWAGMRQALADDVVMDTSGAGGNLLTGAEEFLTFLKPALEDTVTVHHGHMPEIELTWKTEARGIWALQDLIRWPDGTDMVGSGHYHETYKKFDRAWRITSSRLTRLRVDFTQGVQT